MRLYSWEPLKRDEHYITKARLPKKGAFRNFKTIETLSDLLTITYSNGFKRHLMEPRGNSFWTDYLKRKKMDGIL